MPAQKRYAELKQSVKSVMLGCAYHDVPKAQLYVLSHNKKLYKIITSRKKSTNKECNNFYTTFFRQRIV